MSNAKELLEEIYKTLSPAFFPPELHLKLSRYLNYDLNGHKRVTPLPWVVVSVNDQGKVSDIKSEHETKREALESYKKALRPGVLLDCRVRPCNCVGFSHRNECIEWVLPF